jgi:hypothetical protein
MTCANTMSSLAFAVSAPTPVRGDRRNLTAALVAVAEAFQDALELRRAAHERRPLDDE